MYYEQCTLNIVLFTKLECPPMCITSQFAKCIVCQIYCVYAWYLFHKHIKPQNHLRFQTAKILTLQINHPYNIHFAYLFKANANFYIVDI